MRRSAFRSFASSPAFATAALAVALLTSACDSNPFELHPRLPEHEGLTCEEVCESTVSDDENYHVQQCEEVLTVDDEPAVLCLFWETVI